MEWEIIKENSKDYWLELKGWDGGEKYPFGELDKRTKIYSVHIACKWDGCIDYRTYSNGYSYDHECDDDCPCCQDYIHICDIDEFIKDLQQLKKVAIQYYKGKSGEEYWKEEQNV
ncbi:MAG: hypothetical protein PHN88_09120 [Ignavibacteria bacterium]|nr:hypothetical protein [Ignavibacteria bacterium]